PGRSPAAVAPRGRQRGTGARGRLDAGGGARAPRPRRARPGRARRLRKGSPAPALGRQAQRGGARPQSRGRARAPADGRAVLAARCPDPREHAPRAHPHSRRAPHVDPVRHPRRRGGGGARRPHRDDVGAAGSRPPPRRRFAAAAAPRHRTRRGHDRRAEGLARGRAGRGAPAMTRFLLALAIACAASAADAQDKIKVGYWSSGFSVGFGAVLEAGKFVEQQGLAPEFIRFADVNGPSKAIITQSIDVAFAAAVTGAFTLGIQGAPIEIVLASQIAEATFVAKDGSPINSLAEIKGKKLGLSPVGSATYAIAAAVLERNFGLKPADYTPVGGNEGQLVSFLQRGDIDAAALRAVTVASVP